MSASREAEAGSMARAIELARLGIGRVEPNPPVGAVLVAGGRVVGEGWHRAFGGPHAEVEALEMAGPAARGASAYVTLEPCCHHGKTPPCTDALLAAGVAEVVYGVVDPNPEVAGRGLALLESAGVTVRRAVDDRACRDLLAAYFKWRRTGRPWVVAKWAMTLDGRIATVTGDSMWITGPAARQEVHRLRDRSGAVVVGIGTALADDPLLTCRIEGGRQPLRVVVDRQARLPSGARLLATLDQAPFLVAVGHDAPEADVGRLAAAGAEVVRFPATEAGIDLGALIEALAERGRMRILVEGGGRLLGSMFDDGLVDEVVVYLGPSIVGGATAPGPVAGVGIDALARAVRVENLTVESIGGDVRLTGRVATVRGSGTIHPEGPFA